MPRMPLERVGVRGRRASAARSTLAPKARLRVKKLVTDSPSHALSTPSAAVGRQLAASFFTTYWFRLIPSSAAWIARLRCRCSPTRTLNLPENCRSDNGSGIGSP